MKNKVFILTAFSLLSFNIINAADQQIGGSFDPEQRAKVELPLDDCDMRSFLANKSLDQSVLIVNQFINTADKRIQVCSALFLRKEQAPNDYLQYAQRDVFFAIIWGCELVANEFKKISVEKVKEYYRLVGNYYKKLIEVKPIGNGEYHLIDLLRFHREAVLAYSQAREIELVQQHKLEQQKIEKLFGAM